jgi:CBS domain containing-hemolysin-like protein
MIDALRWLQLAAAAGLWLVLTQIASLPTLLQVLTGAGITVVLIITVRFLVGSLSERNLAFALRTVRPLTWPLLSLLGWAPPKSRGPTVAPIEVEEEEASEREIQAYRAAGEAAGIFEADEGEMLESLVEFFDTVVREVMTPRTEMIVIAENADYAELIQLFAETHKSRIPVFRETVDTIVGVIHVKNLVENLMSGQRPSIESLRLECLVVPESKRLGDLLSDFQREHQQMAIVVDEYGGTSGLVTLEDVLEEIVGEIQDEHDPSPEPESLKIGDGEYRLQGRAPLEVLQDHFGVEVDEDDFDTVGGLVFSRHGTVPEAGTEVEDPVGGLAFTVEEMEGRRIVSVVVRRLSEDDQAEGE